jgi:DNA-damage-inducible protein D
MEKLEIKEYEKTIFEKIKHIDELGNEYWEARELQKVLEYKEWRKFESVIEKAKLACLASKNKVSCDFVGTDKIVEAGATRKKIEDYKLSRYACYLIVQNGDSRKEVIGLGQTYFAIQTRKQELSELDYISLPEDGKRLYKRNKTRIANYSLQQVAIKAGVKNMDKFHNAGYKGLYNGETANDIFKRKGLRYREDILDNMGSEELAANEFRISQTEAKIKRDNICGEKSASDAHFEIGTKVRKAIADMGGTMPEKLPTPERSLKEIEKKQKEIGLN